MDRFSGDASTLTFTLTRKVAYATDIEVFVENIQQEPLTAYDVNSTSLIFTEAPPSGTLNVYVYYRQASNNSQVTLADGSVTYAKLANNIRLFTTDNLTANGNNSVFVLSEEPADANTVFVTIDGIVQRAPVHYTTSGTTITFTSAPPALSNVHVRHLGFRTSVAVTALSANSFISTPNIASPTITGTGTATFSNITVTNTSTLANITGPLTITGNVLPSSNSTFDLGSASFRWSNIYTGDLHLSNEGRESGNLIDGTKGNWTVQEGEQSLFLINNKTGKKYRFAIEEIE